VRERIYIAGPYSTGDVAVNVHNAMAAFHELADRGFAPFCPHLSHFLHMQRERPYEFWIELDNQFLPFCQGVLRLPGESRGADGEVELARKLEIPVFSDVPSVNQHFGNSFVFKTYRWETDR
jgi:hypothetical protein